jgi:hypothetical protein
MTLGQVAKELEKRAVALVQILRLRFGSTSDGIPLRRLPYVFIIGFNKTGTRSLTDFFEAHGLPSVHWDSNKMVHRMLRNIEKQTKVLKGYDSRFLVYSDLMLSDDHRIVEGNQFFERLFVDYPGSLFILNTRPTQNWIQSRIRHRNGLFMARQMKLLGAENPNQVIEMWRTQKSKHEAAVRNFFMDKPSQFIELNIENVNVPELLEDFLPFKIDSTKWSHVGKSTATTEASLEKAIGLAKLSKVVPIQDSSRFRP